MPGNGSQRRCPNKVSVEIGGRPGTFPTRRRAPHLHVAGRSRGRRPLPGLEARRDRCGVPGSCAERSSLFSLPAISRSRPNRRKRSSWPTPVAALDTPVFRRARQHDWPRRTPGRITRVLAEVASRCSTAARPSAEIGGTEVGIVGTKGSSAAFQLSPAGFGEPSCDRCTKRRHRDRIARPRAAEVAVCPVKDRAPSLLAHGYHASRRAAGIWAFLGKDRMAPPIAEHSPASVLHGHAPRGDARGFDRCVPVVQRLRTVLGRDFWTFEMSGVDKTLTPIH